MNILAIISLLFIIAGFMIGGVVVNDSGGAVGVSDNSIKKLILTAIVRICLGSLGLFWVALSH
jgi:hypothetical protein